MAKQRNPTKPSKTYVEDKNAAIDLARSVADIAEEKAKTKIRNRHLTAATRDTSKTSVIANPATGRTSTSTSSKGRLERAKAAVAARAAQAKRAKAKGRKKARSAHGQHIEATAEQTEVSTIARRAPGGAKTGDEGAKRVRFG
ncbi:uncharacterized protein BXZ73DRAFT_107562 [Epithele typhae]|uniref:uncharacterized protein n=1 Tax=Epithele typhae TaxID=378194 RepID=UPI002007237E|nr:uncharacterized protein BXZ73DRAFT_107562 [Epithele typhae]KAH9912193.1 hypothetical protein BXZ73DRAFT_107562 [Epithele typhae]